MKLNEEPPPPAKLGPRFMLGTTKALSDWLSLLDGPSSDTFRQIIRAADWPRLLKLQLLSVSLSAIVLGLTITVASFTDFSRIIGEPKLRRPIVAVLLTGVVLASVYSGLSRVFGIRISLAQSFFVFLLLWTPWLPVLSLFQAIIYLPPFPGIFLVSTVVPALILLKPVSNFCKGISDIAECSKLRVWSSVIIPVLVFVGLLILMYGFK